MQRLFILRERQNMQALIAFLRANAPAMAKQGRPLAVAVEEHKAKRNSRQNRLMWAVLRQISEAAWIDGKQYSSEAWHAFYAGRFIGWEEAPCGNRIPISTTTLDVHAFAEYVTRIQAHAATELGIELI